MTDGAYQCTACKNDSFTVIVTDDGLSFIQCVACGRAVSPEHHSLQSATYRDGGVADE